MAKVKKVFSDSYGMKKSRVYKIWKVKGKKQIEKE